MPSPASAVDRAITAFTTRHGDGPAVVVRAPGRVNLIGEHTDYNDGFVFPMALPFATAIAASPTADGLLHLDSEGFGTGTVDLATDAHDTQGWTRYVHGMVQELRAEGLASQGWRGSIATDIPAGAGLSSSAALEVATGLVAAALTGRTADPMQLAAAGQRVESRFFGLHGGLLDQLASTLPDPGEAILIDCRDLRTRRVVLPVDAAVVVMDTGTRRVLAESAYRDRRDSCRAAAAQLGIGSLRDATREQLAGLPEGLRRRARHVVTENDRTISAAAAAAVGDSVRLGQLMSASHASLRDDYDVSGPALDAIVDAARAHPACLGARMTGGGFAGCAVALVTRKGRTHFLDDLAAGYGPPDEQPPASPPRFWAVEPASGASVVAR